jgi:hypothetical protein
MASYPLEIEIAHYILDPYVNDLDLGEQVGEEIFQHLSNGEYLAVLNHQWSFLYPDEPTPELPRIHGLTKPVLSDHMNGRRTLHFRSGWSRRNCHSVGFGAYDRAWQEHPTRDVLNLDSPRQTFAAKHAILAVLDVDAHPGAHDADCVRDIVLWVLGGIFKHAYYEPSTSGTGWHIYIALMLDREHGCLAGHPLRRLMAWFHQFVQHVNEYAESEGLDARLDPAVGGLPSMVQFASIDESDEEGQAMLLEVGRPPAVSIERAHMAKLPRFPNGMEDVMRFAAAPVHIWQLLEPIVPVSCPFDDTAADDEGRCEIESAEPADAVLPRPAVGDGHNTCNPTLSTMSGDQGDRGNPGGASFPVERDDQMLDAIAAHGDGMKRRLYFTLLMVQRYGPDIEPEWLEVAYRQAGLAHNRSKSFRRRQTQFKSCLKFVRRSYDPALALSPWDWEALSKSFMPAFEQVLADEVYNWSNGDNKKRRVRARHLAAVFFVVRAKTWKKRLPQRITQTYVRKAAEDKCSMSLKLPLIARSLDILQELGLIRLVHASESGRTRTWQLTAAGEALGGEDESKGRRNPVDPDAGQLYRRTA